ncbi:MAG: DUF3300 domain-containing protein [Psychromonas sp.]|nr:DUF3300 domain-containing protein [Psychromonas sp.]
MSKVTAVCYRSLSSVLIILLILMSTSGVLVNNVNAEEVYSEQDAFSEGELAQILAPIALYPDTLLTHILIASTYPLEIVKANRWRMANRQLSATQAMQQSEDKEWDPSIRALLAFPNVLEKLSNDLNWTQKLGDAFLQNESAVLNVVQLLRQQADAADSLAEMDKMSVTRLDHQIIIESSEKEVVYVPYYDPRVVYGHWYWYRYPPVYWPPYPYYRAHSHSHFYWGSAIHIVFNYYFSSFDWPQRYIVIVNHHHSQHYRPRERIVSSYGAQRWIHNPKHRHGVVYRSQHVQQRYHARPLRSGEAKRLQNKLREQQIEVKKNSRKEYNRSKLAPVSKQRVKPSSGKQMHSPLMNAPHKQLKHNKEISGAHQKNGYRNIEEGKRPKQVKREPILRNRNHSGGNAPRERLLLDNDSHRR